MDGGVEGLRLRVALVGTRFGFGHHELQSLTTSELDFYVRCLSELQNANLDTQ